MTRVQHPLDPIWNSDSRVLILGTMPSPQSRKKQFYYAHPQNRFWKVMASVLEEECPETNDAKRAMLLRRGIALWDVLLPVILRGQAIKASAIRGPTTSAVCWSNAPSGRCLPPAAARLSFMPLCWAAKASVCHPPAPQTARFRWNSWCSAIVPYCPI